jgi:hypothetical protein
MNLPGADATLDQTDVNYLLSMRKFENIFLTHRFCLDSTTSHDSEWT